ncbi:MAG: hypothetical protein ACODAC_04535 [Pseudomonadota bacterium]
MTTFRKRLAGAGLMLLATTHAHAFGGSIAIGMSRITGGEDLDVSFTAKATLESAEFDLEETIHYRPGMLRDEMQVQGQNMVTIQRHDLGTMWMIMPYGMYMEADIDQADEQMQAFELVTHEQVASETVNGMDTTKHKTVWEMDDDRYTGYSWTTDDGITVRSVLTAESGNETHEMRFEITSLERGPQSENLFEVPDGYQKIDLSAMENMGNMDGMGGMGNMGN